MDNQIIAYPYNVIFSYKKKFPSLKCGSASSNFKLTSTSCHCSPDTHTHTKRSGQRDSERIIESELTFIAPAQLCCLKLSNKEH